MTAITAGTFSPAFIDTWNANLIHLAQQGDTRLRSWVMEKNKGTSHDVFTRMAERAALTQKTDIATTTPNVASTLTNRVAVPTTWHTAELVEPEEIARTLIDPKSGVLHSMAATCKRKIDDLIISAATGTALTDRASTTEAFPAGQALGSASTEFSYDLVCQALELFLDNDIAPEVEKCFVISPNCVKKILAMDEATSQDYVNQKLLASNGVVSNWMGFTWILSNRLTDPAPTSLQRYCLAMTRQALGLLVEHDIQTQVSQRDDKSYAYQIYVELAMGAVRVQDEHIVKVHVLES